ncbi:MAG: magnesium transporter [Thermoplasmata archaeon]|nr:magnesium transporter [Thermoplasmata archaeon]
MKVEKGMHAIISAISVVRSIFGRDLLEGFFSLFLCTIGDLITGIVMGVFTGYLKLLPALLIMIPPTIGMRGNIFASLGSRLGTYLHTGEIEPNFSLNPILSQNINSSLFLTASMSILLGFSSAIFANLMGISAGYEDLIVISIATGISSAIIMLLFTFLVAFLSFRKGWDPDNVTAPLITLVGDMVTLPLMFLFVAPVLQLPSIAKDLMVFIFIVLIIALHYLYTIKNEKHHYNRILKESLPILSICGILGLFSGGVLSTRIENFITIPGLLILIPPFLEDGGAIGGILASRISSSLHLGTLDYERILSRNTIRLFLFAHVLSLFVFSLVGLFVYISSHIMGIRTLSLQNLLTVSIISGQILTFLIDAVTYTVSVYSFRKGIDPDNVTIPIITSVIDLLGASCLIGVLILFNLV